MNYLRGNDFAKKASQREGIKIMTTDTCEPSLATPDAHQTDFEITLLINRYNTAAL
jgi:hypothetical protein